MAYSIHGTVEVDFHKNGKQRKNRNDNHEED